MRMVFCFSMAVYYKHGSRRSRRREQMTAKANCFRFGLLGLRAQPVDWLWQRDWQRFFYFLAVGLVVRWGRLHSICDVERNHFFIVLSNKIANFSSFAVKIATKKMKVLLSTTNHIYVIQNTRKKKIYRDWLKWLHIIHHSSSIIIIMYASRAHDSIRDANDDDNKFKTLLFVAYISSFDFAAFSIHVEHLPAQQ